jgi:hypothetical protein
MHAGQKLYDTDSHGIQERDRKKYNKKFQYFTSTLNSPVNKRHLYRMTLWYLKFVSSLQPGIISVMFRPLVWL